MNTVHKTSLAVTLGVVGILALAFFLTTDVFVNSATDMYVPDAYENEALIVSEAYYYVSVVDDLVHEGFDVSLSLEAATKHCETIAYNPDNMWKQVICIYAEEIIYDGTFVAG